MELVITLPEEVQLALEQRANNRGYKDVKRYVERLITADLLAAKSFDEILAPIRQTAQASKQSEAEWDALFEEAREDVYQERKGHR
jgi:hypothetical protein